MATQGLNAEGDAVRVTFLVTGDLLKALKDQWSEPVEIKIMETPGVGTGWEMIGRPLPQGFRVQGDRDGEVFLDHAAADCNFDLEHDYAGPDWTLPELVKIARAHEEREHE